MAEEAGTTPAEAPVFQEISTEGRQPAYAYRPLGVLKTIVVALCGVRVVLAAAQFLSLLGQGALLQRMSDGGFSSQQAMTDAANQSDALVALVGLAVSVALFATYIASAFWIYRAAANVRALGAQHLSYSPGWSVGWYFIPIATWFRPFGAMVEIYRASSDPIRWRTLPTPALLRLWWGVWLADSALAAVVVGVSRSTQGDLEALKLSTTLSLAYGALDAAAVIMFMLVVLRVTKVQTATQRNLRHVAEVFA